jgi:hypothetical protein
MTISREAIKDWIRSGYHQGSKHLFVVKAGIGGEYKPYWVSQSENTELVRELILESGQEIVNELNMDVKLFLLNTIK